MIINEYAKKQVNNEVRNIEKNYQNLKKCKNFLKGRESLQCPPSGAIAKSTSAYSLDLRSLGIIM